MLLLKKNLGTNRKKLNRLNDKVAKLKACASCIDLQIWYLKNKKNTANEEEADPDSETGADADSKSSGSWAGSFSWLTRLADSAG